MSRTTTRQRGRDLVLGLRAALGTRVGYERILPIGVAIIVLIASFVSFGPAAATPGGPIGNTDGAGTEPRIAVGGVTNDMEGDVTGIDDTGYAPVELAGLYPRFVAEQPSEPAIDDGALSGSFQEDGTLVKPNAVNTSIADGKALLQSYTVQSGDTLTGIASRFGVSMMTVWWANDLKTKDDLHVGQVLTVPPVSGLVITVKEGDTLDSLATTYGIDGQDVVAVNGLEDPNLVIGQTLVMPGAAGKGIVEPPQPPRPPGGGGGTVRQPPKYSGGRFLWPVVGGNNYISQYFHRGHYALDIAADYGSRVRAAAAGTVIFAGWKNNGGGYQVWISHGSGIYTTYNHMSAVTVGRGQSVGRGQQVGRIGQSGRATGPHLHFEVWIGQVWDGGSRVNPLRYF